MLCVTIKPILMIVIFLNVILIWCIMTHSITDTYHKRILYTHFVLYIYICTGLLLLCSLSLSLVSAFYFSCRAIIMLSVGMLSDVLVNVIMLCILMLRVVIKPVVLSVVMLNVMVPNFSIKIKWLRIRCSSGVKQEWIILKILGSLPAREKG
jgi:hypothetical protein